MKNYVFSNHAQKQLELRSLTKSMVIEALENPDRIEQSREIWSAKKYLNNGHLLIVYFDEKENNVMLVVTIIETSKVKKYLPLL